MPPQPGLDPSETADGAATETDGSADDLPRMTLMEHLEELRKRLIRSVIALIAGFCLCFFFVEEISEFLAQPVYAALARAEALEAGLDVEEAGLGATAGLTRIREEAWPWLKAVASGAEPPAKEAKEAEPSVPDEGPSSDASTDPEETLKTNPKLTVLGVPDAFVVYVKVALLTSLFLTSPFLFFQFWAFVSPGLYRKERMALLPFAILSTFFFVGGAVFAYLVAFPMAVDFLIGVGKNFHVVVTADRYYRFLLFVILGLGVMFQLPVLVVLLARLGLVTPRFLLRNFRWAVLIIFVMAAILTPTPDVVNLCVFALPTIALYLLGILGAAIFGKKPAEAEPA